MSGTELFTTLLGSVALLLWGVRMVRTGALRGFGTELRNTIATRTRSKFSAFLAGIGVTGILQSSTATAILLASFSARNLIALPLALAVMLGADVGSALAAQIFSLDVKWLWSVLVAAGVFLFLVSTDDRRKALARVVIGLGLIFLALGHIGIAAAPLRESPTFHSIASSLAGEPLLAILLAAAMAWLAHSSLSIVLLVMSLCATHTIPLPLALVFILGANIGGAIAPFLSLLSSPATARRVPLGNMIMRLVCAIPLFFAVKPIAASVSDYVSDTGRIVIGFHAAFNLLTAVSMLPLVGWIAKLSAWLMPDKEVADDLGRPKYLDPAVLEISSEAIACAIRETQHLGDIVMKMLRDTLSVFEKSDAQLMREVEKSDDTVDRLHEAIKLYLVRSSKEGMTGIEAQRYAEVLTFTTNLEHVGDIIDKSLMELAAKKIKKKYSFSAEGFEEIRSFHAHLMDNMRLSFNVFVSRDVILARRLLSEKSSMRSLELKAAENHYIRLREGRPESIESSAIHLDVIRDLKRINGHLTSVAYPILEAAGELGESRLLSSGDAIEPQLPNARAS